jgi:hypothetical protein
MGRADAVKVKVSFGPKWEEDYLRAVRFLLERLKLQGGESPAENSAGARARA